MNCKWSFSDDASDEFQRLLDDSSDIQNKLMSSICVNLPTPDDIGTDQYKPRVQITTVPERFQSFLPCLAQRYSSALFCHMLETFSKLQKISSEDKWWDVLVSVWQQTEVEWQQTCEAMRSGQITFPEAEKLFSIFENSSDQIEKCKRELQKMIGNDGNGRLVNLRIQQFQCLSGINSKKNAAKVLSQIKKDFGFCGDLEDIQAFQDFVSNWCLYSQNLLTSIPTLSPVSYSVPVKPVDILSMLIAYRQQCCLSLFSGQGRCGEWKVNYFYLLLISELRGNNQYILSSSSSFIWLQNNKWIWKFEEKKIIHYQLLSRTWHSQSDVWICQWLTHQQPCKTLTALT